MAKYGIVLHHPGQPSLLLSKATVHTILCISAVEPGDCVKVVPEKPKNHVHKSPELLASIDVPESILKACYLIPSLMLGSDSLLSASQLGEEIALFDVHRPSSLILEAFTTLRCCETFLMERLELLGLSVLKNTMSCHLFLKYQEYHEGKLPARRSLEVCNASLRNFGAYRKLQWLGMEVDVERSHLADAIGRGSLLPCWRFNMNSRSMDFYKRPLPMHQNKRPGIGYGPL
ncbi:Endoribonuclease Dicer homolog 3b-like protein [Drosera capensis]